MSWFLIVAIAFAFQSKASNNMFPQWSHDGFEWKQCAATDDYESDGAIRCLGAGRKEHRVLLGW